MNDQKIIDNATHVDTEGDYWLISSQDKPQVYLHGEWTYCEPRSTLRSLVDIKRIAELENHIQSLKIINEYIDEGCPDVNVIRSEIGEVISRVEGAYFEALKEQIK